MSTSEQKPTTITAIEFMEGGYVKMIKEKKCEVRDTVDDEPVDNLVQEWRGIYAYTWTDGEGMNWGCHADEQFTVEWLQPAAGVTEAQGSEEDELTALRAENARLREALEPFAKIYSDYGSYYDPYTNLIMYIVENIDNEVLYTAMKNAYEQLPTGDK